MDADVLLPSLARVYAKSADPPFRRIRHVNRSLRKTRPLHEAKNLHKQSNMTRIAALLAVIGGTLGPCLRLFVHVTSRRARSPDLPCFLA